MFEEIYQDTIDTFSRIWSYKKRENRLEIITPFATVNNMFVSVFITKKDDEFIISDGEWLKDKVYGNIKPEYYRIKDKFYIMETENDFSINAAKNLPHYIFEMANFISLIVNLSNI